MYQVIRILIQIGNPGNWYVAWNGQASQKVMEEINKLIGKRVIEYTKHGKGDFISPILFRSKSDGTTRLILNLNWHVAWNGQASQKVIQEINKLIGKRVIEYTKHGKGEPNIPGHKNINADRGSRELACGLE